MIQTDNFDFQTNRLKQKFKAAHQLVTLLFTFPLLLNYHKNRFSCYYKSTATFHSYDQRKASPPKYIVQIMKRKLQVKTN